MYWKIRKIWKKFQNYYWGDHLDVRYYLCEQIAGLKNKRILDLGCNIGIISGVADGSNKIVGIDLNKNTLKIAQRLFPKNSYFYQDIYKFADKSFDVVILAHMIDRNTRHSIMKKSSSFLKKGGSLYITVPNRLNDYYKETPSPTLAELIESLQTNFMIKETVLWNPISIRTGHFAFPGAYTLMKWISLLFQSKKSVSIFIRARKR